MGYHRKTKKSKGVFLNSVFSLNFEEITFYVKTLFIFLHSP